MFSNVFSSARKETKDGYTNFRSKASVHMCPNQRKKKVELSLKAQFLAIHSRFLSIIQTATQTVARNWSSKVSSGLGVKLAVLCTRGEYCFGFEDASFPSPILPDIGARINNVSNNYGSR